MAVHNHGDNGGNIISGGLHRHKNRDIISRHGGNDAVGRFSWNWIGTYVGDQYDYPETTLDYQDGFAEGTGHRHNISPSGSNQPHNNMQPYLVINYIIKF
jgi:hypothetical protein